MVSAVVERPVKKIDVTSRPYSSRPGKPPPRELRENGLSGTLLEVECEAPVEALELLAHVPGVREVTLYGALLHVLVDELSPEDLARALRDHGQRVISVRPIRPSLEDVFVSCIRSQTDARLTG